MFLKDDWPGNVRELENMIKRFVILQDEALVSRELQKPRVAAESIRPPALGHEQLAPPAYHAPPAESAVEDDSDDDGHGEEESSAPAATPQDGRRLSDVSREAALTAERAIISDTLRQVRWNRRKAAQLLGVSYKTLLNKIKETGLEQP